MDKNHRKNCSSEDLDHLLSAELKKMGGRHPESFVVNTKKMAKIALVLYAFTMLYMLLNDQRYDESIIILSLVPLLAIGVIISGAYWYGKWIIKLVAYFKKS